MVQIELTAVQTEVTHSRALARACPTAQSRRTSPANSLFANERAANPTSNHSDLSAWQYRRIFAPSVFDKYAAAVSLGSALRSG